MTTAQPVRRCQRANGPEDQQLYSEAQVVVSNGASDLGRNHKSGRRESNPRDQLGRLVTHSDRPSQLAAVTRRYGVSIPLRCLFG